LRSCLPAPDTGVYHPRHFLWALESEGLYISTPTLLLAPSRRPLAHLRNGGYVNPQRGGCRNVFVQPKFPIRGLFIGLRNCRRWCGRRSLRSIWKLELGDQKYPLNRFEILSRQVSTYQLDAEESRSPSYQRSRSPCGKFSLGSISPWQPIGSVQVLLKAFSCRPKCRSTFESSD
jgi:hypothetical protein